MLSSWQGSAFGAGQEAVMAEVQLSKRERQIMDVIYARGEATAKDVVAGMEDAPSRSAVRTFLTILEQKGHVRHRKAGQEYVYLPTRGRRDAGKSALRRVLKVFFGGSLDEAVAAHLLDSKSAATKQELARLTAIIDEARRKGR